MNLLSQFTNIDFRIRNSLIIFFIAGCYFFILTIHSFSVTTCVFKTITGIPCPGCGGTRATLLLFHGHIWESLKVNPSGIIMNLFLAIATCWLLIDILMNRDRFYPLLLKPFPVWITIIIIVLILANWVWNIIKGN